MVSPSSPSLHVSAQAGHKLRVRKRLRQAEIKEQVAAIDEIPRAPKAWKPWLDEVLPEYFGGGFAKRHVDFWKWVWSIEPGDSPRPYVAVWPRGGGKSTGAEGAAVALGAPRLAEGRAPRRYCVYVRETQKQADDSVSNIREMLESDRLGVYYPALGQPSLGKHGLRKGWRRQRLIAASGYVIDALGLDTAARGLKVGVLRPDLIIFDDIDGRHDARSKTRKKIETITDSILPMGTEHCAVLVIQNRMIPNGVVRRLEDRPAHP